MVSIGTDVVIVVVDVVEATLAVLVARVIVVVAIRGQRLAEVGRRGVEGRTWASRWVHHPPALLSLVAVCIPCTGLGAGWWLNEEQTPSSSLRVGKKVIAQKGSWCLTQKK